MWQVLAPGGAKEPIDVLSDFLGREPSIQAFIDSKAEYSLWDRRNFGNIFPYFLFTTESSLSVLQFCLFIMDTYFNQIMISLYLFNPLMFHQCE